MIKTLHNTLALLALSTLLVACGGGGSSSTGSGTTPTAVPTAVPTTAPTATPVSYRLHEVREYNGVIENEELVDLILHAHQSYTYNANNEQHAQIIDSISDVYPLGREAMRIDFTYDAANTTETDVVTLTSFDAWSDAGTGEMMTQLAWEDEWSNGNLVGASEHAQNFDSDGGVTSENFHDHSRTFFSNGKVDFNTVDFGSDGSIDELQEYTWGANGVETSISWAGDRLANLEEAEYVYDDESGRLIESYHFTQDILQVRIYDYSTVGTLLIVIGNADSNGNVTSMLAEEHIYERGECGEGILKRANAFSVKQTHCLSW